MNFRSMDLRRLRYFIAVAEELNFRRAADRLNISQPPLSQQIQALEADLGATLFLRDRRSVELTEAGEVLLRRARAILASATGAATEVRRVGRGELGRLVVGFMSAAMLSRLAATLGVFRAARPAVDVHLTQLSPREQIAAVAAGHVDVGFLSIAPSQRSIAVGEVEILVEPVWEEELVVALPADHRLATRAEVSLRDLAAETFVTLPQAPTAGYYDQLTELCRTAGGFQPTIRQEIEQLPAALALIAAGYGIGLMPVCVTEDWHRLVVFPRLTEQPRIAVAMIWRPDNRSPVLATFRSTAGREQPPPFYTAQARMSG